MLCEEILQACTQQLVKKSVQVHVISSSAGQHKNDNMPAVHSIVNKISIHLLLLLMLLGEESMFGLIWLSTYIPFHNAKPLWRLHVFNLSHHGVGTARAKIGRRYLQGGAGCYSWIATMSCSQGSLCFPTAQMITLNHIMRNVQIFGELRHQICFPQARLGDQRSLLQVSCCR